MRLICPNCGAQYEVPDEVIPVAGRDVQCSNCGDTWFQKHADDQSADPDEQAETGFGGKDAPVDAPFAEEPAEDNREVATEAAFDETQDDTDFDAPEPEPEADADAGQGEMGELRRQHIDSSVSEVLREEAAHEAAARAVEQSVGVETQPDLGLQDPVEARGDAAGRRADEARQRMARIRGESATQEAETAEAVPAGSRRNLLPDIEEINSTLRSTKDRRAASDAQDPASPESVPQQRRRRGFRRGFLTMLVLAGVLMLVYGYAPVISAKIPQLEGLLSTYVEMANMARLWLDTQVGALMAWLEALAAA